MDRTRAVIATKLCVNATPLPSLTPTFTQPEDWLLAYLRGILGLERALLPEWVRVGVVGVQEMVYGLSPKLRLAHGGVLLAMRDDPMAVAQWLVRLSSDHQHLETVKNQALQDFLTGGWRDGID